MICIVLLFLTFIWKFSDTEARGWIFGFGLMSVAFTIKGEAYSILTLIFCIGLWRVALDIYKAGK